MIEKEKVPKVPPHPFSEIIENDARRSELQNSGVIPFDEYVKLMQVRRLLTKAAEHALKPAGNGRLA